MSKTPQVTAQQETPSPVPTAARLYNNYPNPFNPSTTIQYDVPAAGFVVLKVFDALGREVATLVNGENGAGTHLVTLDGTNLASGTYFYRLQTAHYAATKKMQLLR